MLCKVMHFKSLCIASFFKQSIGACNCQLTCLKAAAKESKDLLDEAVPAVGLGL